MEEQNEVTEPVDAMNAFDPPEVPEAADVSEAAEASSSRRHRLRTPLAAGLAAGLLGAGVGAGAVAVFANDGSDHDRGRHEEAFDRFGDHGQQDQMGGDRHQGPQHGQQQGQQGQQQGQQGGFMPPAQGGPSQGRSGGS